MDNYRIKSAFSRRLPTNFGEASDIGGTMWKSNIPFPLTLTLSLKEREQQACDWCLADGRSANSGTGVFERRWTVLPLPMGEGWGEGEQSVSYPTASLG